MVFPDAEKQHEMKSSTIRRWSFIHTWTSLVCTLFMLMLALTGLPLIFHHELEHLLGAKVYLELFVKVKSGWAATEQSLRAYGYE